MIHTSHMRPRRAQRIFDLSVNIRKGDTYESDDIAELVAKLDLKNAVHVGHSTAGGEVARYIGCHGIKRVAKALLISAIPPLMLKTPANPGGLPVSPDLSKIAVAQADDLGVVSIKECMRRSYVQCPAAGYTRA